MQSYRALVLFSCFLPLVFTSSCVEKFDELEVENVQLAKALQVVRSENAELKRIVTSLQKRMDDVLEARVTALEESVESMENDIEDQDDRINSLQSQILGNDGDIEDLEDQFDSLEDMTSQLEQMTSQLEEVTSQQNVQLTSLDSRVGELEENGGTNITDSLFFAALSAPTDGEMPLIFDRDVINYGGHYDAITGYYSAPSDGIYQFYVHLSRPPSVEFMYLNIFKNDDETIHLDTWGIAPYRSTAVLLELQAGDTVWVYVAGGANGDFEGFWSYFWGYMISTM